MIPAIVTDILPDVRIRRYISRFQVFRFTFDTNKTPPVKRHYPRPEHCITFYIRDAQNFQYTGTSGIQPYPQCIINGMHTIPVYRHAGHDLLAIKAIFQPTVLFQLLKIPLIELTNTFINAEDIWGSDIRNVCDALRELDNLPEMLQMIGQFIETRLKNIPQSTHPIDKAVDQIRDKQHTISIEWLANQSCLSMRQFIRKFEDRVGISAKKLDRLIRFDKAYRMKNLHPEYDWLLIAVSCDYHDYQHMVRDFKEFAHLTPNALYQLEQEAPERGFGFSYLT